MEQKLPFEEKHVFITKRPDFITKKQEDKLYSNLANEIFLNDWCDSNEDIEEVINDLKNLNFDENGYYNAKQLESNGEAWYNIDSEFVNFLDNIQYLIDDLKTKNVEEWVKIHDIKPKLNLNDKLKVINKIPKTINIFPGDTIYINNIVYSQAIYLISKEKNNNRNFLVNFEDLENNITQVV